MKHGSLFSGIGGFDLAAEWMGWENEFHCEWNTFGQKVLNYYWPNAKSYADITKTDFRKHRGRIDILTGGFPCQPFSVAGQRKGKEDDRYLWPEMLRAIDEIRPRWICGENVTGIVSMVQPEASEITVESQASLFEEDHESITTEQREYVIETICSDLERIGYSVQPIVIPACATGAPHKRDRVWFVAYSKSQRGIGLPVREKTQKPEYGIACCNGNSSNTTGWRGLQNNGDGISRFNYKTHKATHWNGWPTQSPICNGDDGLPTKLDGITFSKWRNESIKAGGNAIVPQVAYQIYKAIQKYEAINDL